MLHTGQNHGVGARQGGVRKEMWILQRHLYNLDSDFLRHRFNERLHPDSKLCRRSASMPLLCGKLVRQMHRVEQWIDE